MARPTKATVAMMREKNIRIKVIGDQVLKSISVLAMYGSYGFIAYCGVEIARAWAGKVTYADISVKATTNMLGGIEVNDVLLYATVVSIMFGIAGIKFGYKQAKLRKDKVEKLQARVTELETKFDKHRTSSRLTPRGDTNPEDVT